MEGTLMSVAVALDASPEKVLRSFRGSIVDVHGGYPDVLHVEVRDSRGGLWRLATQDADISSPDPSGLSGGQIEAAEIDKATGELRCRLADGSSFAIKPGKQEAPDDPPNWELITPEGLALEFGPGVRWQIASADSRPSR
jgi:hypothetical protein